jgi:flavin-dependent dehydrogenase
MAMRRSVDVLVIGGGPAGLAAAIACAREGQSVTLVDPAQPPVDKACGEGILPDGLKALREFGISLPTSARLDGIHFLSEQSADVKAEFSNGRGAGVRRTVLHHAFRKRAVELGVELRWGSRAEEIKKGLAIVDGEECGFRFAVIADGQQSLWRERLRFGDINLKRQRFGFRRHYRVAPWSNYVEVYWAEGAQMYVTPVADDEVCVALLTSDQRADFDEELKRFPTLAARVRGEDVCSKLRGAICATRTVTHVTRGKVALIGDASGSVDAITGDGISIALHAAKALAKAIRTDDLRSYEDAHRKILRRPRQMGELLIALDRHPRFRRRALAAMTKHPEVFAKFLGLHTGAIDVSDFGLRDAMVLARFLIFDF